MNQKKQTKTSLNLFRVLLVFLLVVVTVGMVYQIYGSLNNPIKTVSAIPGTISESLSVTAAAIREETTLELPGKGYTILARDGKRLDKGADWAAAFSSQKQVSDYRKLQECEVLREQLLALQNSTLSGISPQSLEAEISELFLDYLDSSAKGTLASLPEAAAALKEKWGVLSALNAGGTEYTDKKIKELDKKINKLKDSLDSDKKLKTPAAGIYISLSDGQEDGGELSSKIAKAHGEKKSALGTGEIENLINNNAQPRTNDGGKLVTGFVWYFAANVSVKEAQMLKLDKSYTVEVEQAGNERIKLTLESIGDVENGKLPLIFSCTAQDSLLLRLRVTKLRIILKEEEGLKIPREAIRVHEGETGVFVIIGNKINFRRALIRGGDEDYVIARTLSTAEIESLADDVPTKNKSAVALREQQLFDEAEAQKKSRPPSIQRYDKVVVEGNDLGF